ncbi:hypothetical protein DPEC_G00307310 [Dallia pectoralis]|uniref:Uncharacterized protein n=1 Tax=Dallia pectoralis TaxID=75939 RepID=A0ACC2FE77_DALPE|nr:hypothetical protein DPEC_G00307310 [Dallia pectoralis]
MYLYTLGIHLMVCLLATFNHPEFKGLRNALITPKGIGQGASVPYNEDLYSILAPVNIYHKPWAVKTTNEICTTNETTGRITYTSPEISSTTNETTGRITYTRPEISSTTNETTGRITYTRPEISSTTNETIGRITYTSPEISRTTNETTGRITYTSPEISSTTNETTGRITYTSPEISRTTNETTGRITYTSPEISSTTNETTGRITYTRPEISSTTNETTAHGWNSCTLLQCPLQLVQTKPQAPRQAVVFQKKNKDATALRRTTGDTTSRVTTRCVWEAVLETGRTAEDNDLLWKTMVEVANYVKENWEETAGLVVLAFCGWVYIDPISITQLLQVVGGDQKRKRDPRTYRWISYKNIPELVTCRGSAKKKARLFRRYLKGID